MLMRRYILFLLCLCVHGMARGQAGYDYRYWFDNDQSTVRQEHSASGKWQVEADVEGMSETIHAIHIQAVDSEGNESATVTRYFLRTHDKSADKGYYWFDGNSTARQPSALMQGAFSIDVSGLTEGFHTLYYQVVGKDGSPSSVVSRPFYKMIAPEALRYSCWIDNDLSTMVTGQYTGEPVLIDISQVSDGYHVLRVQVEGASSSAVVSRPFMKIPQTDGVEYLKCLCFIDGEFYTAENVPSTGGIVNWSLDVSSLSEGLHHIMVQVATPSGATTETYEADFTRTAITDGIFDITIVDEAEPAYRLNGQRARKADKGLLIRKGKKQMVK